MKVADSPAALAAFFHARNLDPGEAPAADICRACLDFYATLRAEDALPLDEDGDMVLVQWGRSKYDPRPDDFHLDVVRQFITRAPDEEDAADAADAAAQDEPATDYFQLHCTLWLPAAPFAGIANDHLWLYRPADAAAFLARLLAHPVLVRTHGLRRLAHAITLEKV